MNVITMPSIPQLQTLPHTLPLENTVCLELEEGIPIFRATTTVQNRIERLLYQRSETKLTKQENQELDLYEEVDDYLSFVNRTLRNLHLAQIKQTA